MLTLQLKVRLTFWCTMIMTITIKIIFKLTLILIMIYAIITLLCLIKFNRANMLHIPIVHTHDVSKQIPRKKKKFPSGWKWYKTIGSYVSCAFIKIWSTWEVWRALKKLELLLIYEIVKKALCREGLFGNILGN